MNGLEDATVDSFDCDVVMQNNDGHCASRRSRDGHFTFKFLDYRKTWSLPRDILCLSYGCVGFVLNLVVSGGSWKRMYTVYSYNISCRLVYVQSYSTVRTYVP